MPSEDVSTAWDSTSFRYSAAPRVKRCATNAVGDSCCCACDGGLDGVLWHTRCFYSRVLYAPIGLAGEIPHSAHETYYSTTTGVATGSAFAPPPVLAVPVGHPRLAILAARHSSRGDQHGCQLSEATARLHVVNVNPTLPAARYSNEGEKHKRHSSPSDLECEKARCTKIVVCVLQRQCVG